MRYSHKAFTLIETLVAIAILGIAIGGPLYAANRALVVAQNSSNQLTASMLAQEALEYTRQVRDLTYLATPQNPNSAWAVFRSGLSGCRGNNARCTVDAFNLSIPINECGGSCAPLKLTAAKNYTQGAGAPTIFTRTIQVRDVLNSGEVVGQEIIATVGWNFHGAPYSVVLKDILMPWQPKL